MIVRDDRQRDIILDRPPLRIVSLVPSISETLWQLGVGSRLVGITRYCTDPPEIGCLPRCGGTKNPDCDRIVALQPDLVFMSEEENRIEDFERLASRGLRVFVAFPRRIDDVADWVVRVGAAVGCEPAAHRLADAIGAALAAVRASAAGGPRPRIFCPIWKKPWMSFNSDTYTHSVLEACGGENVFADAADRYCKMTLGEVAARRPDLVLLPDEPYPFSAKDLADVAPLVPPGIGDERARVVDGQALSWYGARTPNGLRVIREAIVGGHR